MNGSPEPVEVRLDDQTVDRLARRVAELLRETPLSEGRGSRRSADRFLSAAQVAERWQVDREWVYAHADELGVLRLGSGPRPRLRFDPDRIAERLAPPAAIQSHDPRLSPRSRVSVRS